MGKQPVFKPWPQTTLCLPPSLSGSRMFWFPHPPSKNLEDQLQACCSKGCVIRVRTFSRRRVHSGSAFLARPNSRPSKFRSGIWLCENSKCVLLMKTTIWGQGREWLLSNTVRGHWRTITSVEGLKGYHGNPVCFVFERARAPKHFLFCKGHPIEEIVDFFSSISWIL